METQAERLKRLREAAGYESAEALAEAASLHPHTYRFYERTRRLPESAAVRLAPLLGVSASYLRTGRDLIEVSPEEREAVEVVRSIASSHLRGSWLRTVKDLAEALRKLEREEHPEPPRIGKEPAA